jgi:hypothetical protein
MARRSVLFAVLLAALTLLPSLAAAAGSCGDCFWEAEPDGCAPSCCPCCVPGPTLVDVPEMDEGIAGVGEVVEPSEGRALVSDPRDVFHVPKTSLG